MKILITGASSGLGEELAFSYADKNNDLILLARREDKLENLKKKLEKKVNSIIIIIADVRAFKELQEKLKVIKQIDMIILNAGVSLGHSQDISSVDDFKNLYDVNIIANHAIVEVLLPLLISQKSGKIVFISSLASLFTSPTSLAYSSSKRALNAYADGLRYRYYRHGIKVINIFPGFIESPLTDKNKFKMPFLLSTKDGVKRISNAIDKNKKEYAFPLRFYIVIKAINILPFTFREKIINYFIKS